MNSFASYSILNDRYVAVAVFNSILNFSQNFAVIQYFIL